MDDTRSGTRFVNFTKPSKLRMVSERTRYDRVGVERGENAYSRVSEFLHFIEQVVVCRRLKSIWKVERSRGNKHFVKPIKHDGLSRNGFASRLNHSKGCRTIHIPHRKGPQERPLFTSSPTTVSPTPLVLLYPNSLRSSTEDPFRNYDKPPPYLEDKLE